MPSASRTSLGPTPRRGLRLGALAVAAVLAMTACGGDAADRSEPSATASPPVTASPTPAEPTATTSRDTPTVGGEVAPIGDFCLLEPDTDLIEHVEFAAPRGWQVSEDSCEFFDPALERLEEGTEPDAAIGVRITDTPFARAADTDHGLRDEIRYVGARSGYQAVRIRAVASGEGVRPEGEPVLAYLVDLDPDSDGGGGTLVVSARPSGGAAFEVAAEALDRMFDTFRIVPAVPEPADLQRDRAVVVTRTEVGDSPYTVTYDGDCFRLRPGGPTAAPTDERCDVGAPDDGISGAVLEDGSVRVVAGLAPPVAAFVVSDAASAPYGAVATSLEGATAFAYSPVELPVVLHGVDVGGDRFTSATVG